ncbi:MAG: transporter substrate-binding domain-containing protein [Candidatus Melainabacteria bacterium]
MTKIRLVDIIDSFQFAVGMRYGHRWGIGLITLAVLGAVLTGCGGPKPPADRLAQIRERGLVIAGVKYDSPPFGYLDTEGNLQGFDVELIDILSKKILADAPTALDKQKDVNGNPQTVIYHQVLSSTRVLALNTGSVDMVAATMTITPEREETIDFTDSYYTAHQRVMVPYYSSIKTLAGLKDQTILYVYGTTSEKNIRAKLPTAKLLGFKSSTDAFAALKAGRGNAFTTDDTILAGFMATSCGFRLLPDILSDEPYGIALKKPEPPPDGEEAAEFRTLESPLRVVLNDYLGKMKADGALDQLTRKWMGDALKPKACPK